MPWGVAPWLWSKSTQQTNLWHLVCAKQKVWKISGGSPPPLAQPLKECAETFVWQ